MDINPLYTKKEFLEKINKVFHSSDWLPSAKIKQFFIPSFYRKLKNIISRINYRPIKKQMHYQYSKALMTKGLNGVFNSEEFLDFVSRIINSKVKAINGEIRRFTWEDHTLLHDKDGEKPGFDIIFEFTENWQGSYGGYTVYTDGQGNSSIIYPEPNTLLIVKRKKGVQKFVKYLNYKSENKYRYAFFANIE